MSDRQPPPPPPGSPPPPSYPPPGPPPGQPWGQPPGQPPDSGGGATGWIIALVVGLVALVAVAVVLIVLLVSDDDGDPGADAKAGESSSASDISGSGGEASADEEEIRKVAIESITRWSRAEGGDASACTGIDDIFAVEDGENAEEACRSEVGSNPGAELKNAEVTEIEIDGDEATAKLTFTASSDDADEIEGSQDIELVKDDGAWKVAGP